MGVGICSGDFWALVDSSFQSSNIIQYKIIKMIFKQTKFKVAVVKDGVCDIFDVKQLQFDAMGAKKVTFENNGAEYTVDIDYQRVFLMEFTTKFDKAGQEIYLGDIVKMERNGVSVNWSVGMVDGLPSIVCEQIEAYAALNENNCSKCEKIGNIYKNPELLEVVITDDMWKKMQEAPASETSL